MCSVHACAGSAGAASARSQELICARKASLMDSRQKLAELRSASRLTIPANSLPRNGSLLTPGTISPASVSPLAGTSRSWSHHSSPPSILTRSQPPTPLESPQVSSSYVSLTGTPRRLLMPTVRPPRSTSSPRIPHHKTSPSKSRSRAGSVSTHLSSSERTERAPTPNAPDWIGGGCRFEVVEDQIELEGYQIYAVEKWCVISHPTR